MGFSDEWLALREPADHAAVNPDVRRALKRVFASAPSLAVVDLGCGSGSNLRGHATVLPLQQRWTLVDHDPALLAAARKRLQAWADKASDMESGGLRLARAERELSVGFRQADLSEGDFGPVIEGADLVTAAALFDLVSGAVIDRLAEEVTRRGQVFHTVLTYDGHAAWRPEHLADERMREAFNHHQRTDKGFGQAMGPQATDALARAFVSRGYRVLRGTSPWVVDARYGTLRQALDDGWAEAVTETGRVGFNVVENWQQVRAAADDGVTIIGHEDLLAVPG
jgi:SAM-dependent methyltransferase